MARSTSKTVQTPGATGSSDDASAEMREEGGTVTAADARIAELQAQLAAQAAENARLRAAATADTKLPSVVYEPQTPHGLEKLAASATAGMTVAQVMQAIEDKRLPEPVTSYLCSDGYYVRRG